MTKWKVIWICAWLPVCAAIFGCEKSSPKPASPPPASAAPEKPSALESALRIHWLGKNEIAADRNSTNLLAIWNQPETLKLQAQTLDKLSAAPWRFLLGQTNQTSANLLRPLLDDVVANEGCLEVRKASSVPDAPNEIVLSVRLSADGADLWQSKLATIMESLGGTPASRNPASWILKSNGRSNTIEFARAGDWSVLALAQNHNALLDETIARINSQHAPMINAATNAFLEGFIDFARLGNHSGSYNLPRIAFALRFDEGNVDTVGGLAFPNAKATPLGAWNIPTNLVSANAVSITAVRGLAPYLALSKRWKDLNAGPPPDQCFLWTTRTIAMQTYFAAPMPNASNAAARITDLALRKQGPDWLTNALSGFEKSQNTDGVVWKGLPFFSPFLRSAGTNGENYLIGGFLDVDIPAGPPPGLEQGILEKTNLVYFDRELTGFHVGQWVQLGQIIRFVTGAAQLPTDSASLRWLMVVGSRLNSCSTEVTEIAPGQLEFARKSDLGFSAIELHLLADWLESPEFPFGNYSLLVRSPQVLVH